MLEDRLKGGREGVGVIVLKGDERRGVGMRREDRKGQGRRRRTLHIDAHFAD